MSRNTIIAVGALLVFAAIVAFLTFRPDPETSAAPEGTSWTCSNPSCGHVFNLSLKELADHTKAHYGEPPPCPKDKKPALRSYRCPKCTKVFPIGAGQICPTCKEPMTL